jgi:lysine 2,3-aminomutase
MGGQLNKSMTDIKRQALAQVEEEEPPGICAAAPKRVVVEEDEPPSSPSATNIESIKTRFFGQVPEESWNDWRWHFRNRIISVDELVKYLPVSPSQQSRLKLVTNKYPLAITPYYLSLINPDNPDDPVRKQAVPAFEEVALAGMGCEDPLEEKKHSVVPGLVHRYPDRVLMVLTDVCPMLCRHCTRKREWGGGFWVRTQAEIEKMLDYIRNHTEVRDVIISGGDPLTLSTSNLEDVLAALRRIEHVEIIRIGTRCPVVLPQRIDDELCAMLSKYGPIWLNTHFNHPNEITSESARACDKLVRAGVVVNNQSVLLRGINDTVETQLKLCRGLLKIKARPYYLFQCDEVQGTEHLRTSVETGIKIMDGMRGHTSGLAIPSYVIDLPHGGGKVPIQPNYVLAQTGTELIIRNYQGHVFYYRNPQSLPSNGNGNKNGRRVSGPTQLPMKEIINQTATAKASNENRAVVRS